MAVPDTDAFTRAGLEGRFEVWKESAAALAKEG
jgi:hypothetical protein